MEWDLVRLGDVCQIAKARHDGALLPYIGMEHIESGTGRLVNDPAPMIVKSATFRFNENHVLYGRLRPYLNKVFLPDFEGHCSTEIFPFECGNRVVRRFLFYWLTSEETVHRISQTSTGARMPRANMNAVLDFDLPLPPLAEQERIVAILDEAFAAIATATVNVERNLVNARVVFEGQVDDIFTRKGEGWIEKKLGEIYDVRDGTHSSPKYHESGYPLITSKNLKREGLNFDNVNLISEDDYKKINERSNVHKGDILFAMIGTIGNPIVVEVEPEFAIKNVALFKAREGQESHFLRYYLGSTLAVSKMASESKGTTQKFVGLGYLRNFPISIPNLENQRTLVRELDAFATETQRLESLYQRKLALLAELKQSLLHQAFTGALGGNLDRVLGEAGV